MPTESLGFMVRPAGPGDLNFMRKNWLEATVTWLIPRARVSERTGVKRRLHAGINRLLGTRTCMVACDADDHSHLFGFACGQTNPAVLHYVYIKLMYRRLGLARALVAASCGQTPAIVCTHWGWGLPRDDQDTLTVNGVRLVYVGTMEPPSSNERLSIVREDSALAYG